MSHPETAYVGDTWEFRAKRITHIDENGDRVPTTDETAGVTITVDVWVNNTLVYDDREPLYDDDRDRWYTQFALPKAGAMEVKWRFNVGGLVRTEVQSLRVEQAR